VPEQVSVVVSEYSPIVILIGLWLDSIFAAAPGETLLIAAAFYAGSKGASVWHLFLLGVLGAWLGSYTSYMIGERIGHSESKFLYRLGITPKRIEQVSTLMNIYGSWILVFTRFIPGTRQVVYYIAGLGNMPLLRFHVATLAGILPWAGLAVYAGLVVHDNRDMALQLFRNYGLTAGAFGILILGAYLIWIKVLRRFPGTAKDVEGLGGTGAENGEAEDRKRE